jgi:hypothetical protein
MKVKAKVKRTGRVLIVKPYGFGHIDNTGQFYRKGTLKILEIIKDE